MLDIKFSSANQINQVYDAVLDAWEKSPIMPKTGIKQPIYIKIMDGKQYKTNKQNALFHSLLEIFWSSGLASFDSPMELRRYYKEIAGLVKRESIEVKRQLQITKFEKEMLHECLKRLNFSYLGRQSIYTALRGVNKTEMIHEISWADASKKGAKIALDCLIKDMCQAGVNGAKFDAIMQEITKGIWNENDLG